MAPPYRLQAVVHTAVGEADIPQITLSLGTLRKSSHLLELNTRSDKHGLENWRERRGRCHRLSNSKISGLTVTSLVISQAFSLEHPIHSEDHICRAKNEAWGCGQFGQLHWIQEMIIRGKRCRLNAFTE